MPKAMALSEGFWDRVAIAGQDECWLWLGALKDTGYGQLTRLHISRSPLKAHRVAYELTNGPIQGGLHVLHRCDNRRCVNPAHLFLGTNDDNVRDMFAKKRNRMAPAEINRAKTHCPRGHEYDRIRVHGWRSCRTCQRLLGRKRRRAA